ncbi:MAG: Smr/MutS family protein [Candidatus Zhuqueibacterota bacterium]
MTENDLEQPEPGESEEEYFSEPIIVTDVLDLHGFFPEQVHEIVTEFIRNAMELKLTMLRIIHGKGRSKLKWTVHQVLNENPHVARFGDARPEMGGWGATIVELK